MIVATKREQEQDMCNHKARHHEYIYLFVSS